MEEPTRRVAARRERPPLDTGSPRRISEHPLPKSARMRRREFLALAGGVAIYTALRPSLALANRAAQLDGGLQPWTLPAEPSGNPLDRARALIGVAVLAPSHWNAQPWRFEAEGDEIRLLAEGARALPAIDPDRRSMMLGLGAALENLLIAARAWGLQPTVEYFPSALAYDVVARVTLARGGPRRDEALFEMIPERRTNRRGYDGRGIYPQNRAQLMAQFSEDTHIHWLDDHVRLRELADLAHDATREEGEDRRAAKEQAAWMRADDEARRHGDGVIVGALEYPGLAHWMPGRAFDPDSWFHRFGVESAARQARDGVRSSGAAALITTARGGASAWLAAGQTCQRFALRATQLGISLQPLSAPLEVERARAPLLGHFDAVGEEPALLVRLGHASQPDPAVRRGVALVASFRTT